MRYAVTTRYDDAGSDGGEVRLPRSRDRGEQLTQRAGTRETGD